MKAPSSLLSECCHVDVLNRQREIRVTPDPKVISHIVHTVLLSEGESADCVTIHFLSDKMMRQYHLRFFGDSSSTDCMSFPIDEKPQPGSVRHLGDVFVCPMTALLYANLNEELFWKEITLYIVHGVLHLLGYDDIDPKSRSLMRRRERRALLLLEKQNICLCGTVIPSNLQWR